MGCYQYLASEGEVRFKRGSVCKTEDVRDILVLCLLPPHCCVGFATEQEERGPKEDEEAGAGWQDSITRLFSFSQKGGAESGLQVLGRTTLTKKRRNATHT